MLLFRPPLRPPPSDKKQSQSLMVFGRHPGHQPNRRIPIPARRRSTEAGAGAHCSSPLRSLIDWRRKSSRVFHRFRQHSGRGSLHPRVDMELLHAPARRAACPAATHHCGAVAAAACGSFRSF
ncbi:hypothetical protein SEVIR_2G303750v4 [Setaria viridis]